MLTSLATLAFARELTVCDMVTNTPIKQRKAPLATFKNWQRTSTINFNAFGDSFGYSPSVRHIYTSNTVTGDSGWSDSVLYTTPNMGGFTGTFNDVLGHFS